MDWQDWFRTPKTRIPREAAGSFAGSIEPVTADHRSYSGGTSMSIAAGFFVDWDGNARSTLDPGGGYVCETDPVARYVAITTKGGTLVHEGTFYKSVADIEKAGIKTSLVPGAHPWGRREDGF
jgi:hypothetical protein